MELPCRFERERGPVRVHRGVPAGILQQPLVDKEIDDVRDATNGDGGIGEERGGNQMQRRVLAALYPVAATQHVSAGDLHDRLGGYLGQLPG